jgi:hypothetical protein
LNKQLSRELNGGSCGESLYDEAANEASRHRWIQSQKMRRDLGEAAEDDWYRLFWSIFCRWRFLDHLCGRRRFVEFSDEEFGLARRLFDSGDMLVARVLDLAHLGMENLAIIQWAYDTENVCPDAVVLILLELNLNRAQFMPIKPPHFALPRTIQVEQS